MTREKIKKALAGVGIAGLIATGGLGVAAGPAHGMTGCGSSCGKGKQRVEGKKTGCGSSCGGKNMGEKMQKMHSTSCGGNMTIKGKTSCGGTSCGKRPKTSCGGSGCGK